jgi:thiamine biosynthesis lipoprotein
VLDPAAFAERAPGRVPVALGGETMGTRWSVRAIAPPGSEARLIAAIQGLLDRIVGQMSQWEPDSELSRFNRAPLGSPQQLSPELSRVLAAGLDVAAASGGAFDPAMGALASLWGFGPAGPRKAPPDAASVQSVLLRSGARHLDHDRRLLVARRTTAAELDFSGIAKGYAVDALAELLAQSGVGDFLVEIGGELRGAGVKPDGQPWWVEVQPVPEVPLPPLRIALHGLAIATSGDYLRHFVHAGRRYAHTLDPRTGTPLDNGVASVTVLHAECMLADAWATALTVLGPDDGMLVAAREGLSVQMVLREGGPRELLSPALEAML